MRTLTSDADTAMVGTLGAAATAAVAINQSSILFFNGIFLAISVQFLTKNSGINVFL